MSDPDSLLEVIAKCREVATVADDAWELEQARLRLEAARDDFDASLPRGLAWARFSSKALPERVVGPGGAQDAITRSQHAVRCSNVLWYGPPAVGKSSLAAAAARAWVESTQRPALWVSAEKLVVARIQHRAGNGEAPLVTRAMSAPLVILDDLGAGGTHASDANGDVIRARVNNDLPLWITTGLEVEEMIARYDGGVVRRIYERAMRVKLGKPKDGSS
jgi:DNA replication protein DnaC